MVSNNNFESLHMTQSLPLQVSPFPLIFTKFLLFINVGNFTSTLFIFQTYSANNIVSLNDNFIEGETFEVILKRNSLGLGLSITGKPIKTNS